MHIEPGLVDAAKIPLSYVTAAVSLGLAGKAALADMKSTRNALTFAARAAISTAIVFVSFELLPHPSAGVSEVHLILGTTLLLLFGVGPAAAGLALGLLLQSLFFAPDDLPQYGMNVTTLLLPLFAMSALAKRIIPANTAYTDLSYSQVLKLSLAYQGGIIAWVAFWSIYGQGFAAENLSSIGSFALAYAAVIVIEPLVDLLVLAGAKWLARLKDTGLFHARLYHAAT